MRNVAWIALVIALAPPLAQAQTVTPGDHLITKDMVQLDTRVKGRVEPSELKIDDVAPNDWTRWTHSWPGVYWYANFKGTEVTVRFEDTVNQYNLLIDGKVVNRFTKPGVHDFRISGLSDTEHTIELDKISEDQGAPAVFDGFFVPAGQEEMTPHWLPSDRQIEFIGDSYTVGYGNTSPKQQCTEDEVWATTDTSQAFGPMTARHERASYQINAISGRGIVRNYNGFAASPLPQAYPYTLFGGDQAYDADDWNWAPQIIVIGLGTNDFSTPLNPGEKWATRGALHADYEATYVKFVQDLRAKNPQASFILMATDQVNGEIQTEVQNVIAKLNAAGETRIAFIPMNNLTFGGCNWHPTTADDKTVEGLLEAYIDARPELWQGK